MHEIKILLTTSDIIAIASAIVAAASLFFSIWFSAKQIKVNKQQQDLNDFLLAKEKADIEQSKKAELGARIIKLGSNHDQLRIFNIGKCSARNVELFIDDMSWVCSSDINSKFPLEELIVQSNVNLIASFHLGSPSKFDIKLTWSDDFSNTNERKLVVTR